MDVKEIFEQALKDPSLTSNLDIETLVVKKETITDEHKLIKMISDLTNLTPKQIDNRLKIIKLIN